MIGRKSTKIVYYGDKRLTAKNETITEITPELKKEARLMIKMMYKYNGIGLAAPQIGINKRIVVIDMSFGKSDDEIMVLFNPEIIKYSEEIDVMEEGCLSFPELYVPVKRSLAVTVRALNLNGEQVEFEADGFLARVLQHEIDHSNGTLMTDRITPADRMTVSDKLSRIKELAEIKA